MTKRYLKAYLTLLIFGGVYAQAENPVTNTESDCIKEEFDVREYWYDGMSWDNFNNIKVNLERPALIKYQDKIEQQKMAKELGLEVPKTYIASREKEPLVDLISTLPSEYVAKATHMSWGDGLVIVKNGINMMTDRPITPEQVEKAMHKVFKKRARDGQPWALYKVKPGFMIQEYIPNRMEVKVQTVFGTVIVGLWMGGETSAAITPGLGQFDRDGNIVRGTSPAPEWWPKAVAAAELLAQGTDALRVDFLVRENGELLLNEIEFYPEISWSQKTKEALANAVNEGYRNLKCKPPKKRKKS